MKKGLFKLVINLTKKKKERKLIRKNIQVKSLINTVSAIIHSRFGAYLDGCS